MKDTTTRLEGEFAMGGLALLHYLTDLFTIVRKDSFSRESLLVILNAVIHDPELFAPEDVAAFQAMMRPDTATAPKHNSGRRRWFSMFRG